MFKLQSVKLEPELWAAFRGKLAENSLNAQVFFRAKVIDFVGGLPEGFPEKKEYPPLQATVSKTETVQSEGLLSYAR